MGARSGGGWVLGRRADGCLAGGAGGRSAVRRASLRVFAQRLFRLPAPGPGPSGTRCGAGARPKARPVAAESQPPDRKSVQYPPHGASAQPEARPVPTESQPPDRRSNQHPLHGASTRPETRPVAAKSQPPDRRSVQYPPCGASTRPETHPLAAQSQPPRPEVSPTPAAGQPHGPRPDRSPPRASRPGRRSIQQRAPLCPPGTRGAPRGARTGGQSSTRARYARSISRVSPMTFSSPSGATRNARWTRASAVSTATRKVRRSSSSGSRAR